MSLLRMESCLDCSRARHAAAAAAAGMWGGVGARLTSTGRSKGQPTTRLLQWVQGLQHIMPDLVVARSPGSAGHWVVHCVRRRPSAAAGGRRAAAALATSSAMIEAARSLAALPDAHTRRIVAGGAALPV